MKNNFTKRIKESINFYSAAQGKMSYSHKVFLVRRLTSWLIPNSYLQCTLM